MVTFVSVVLCVITLSVVLMISYSLSMGISKPLTGLIRVANVINDNATEKNIIGHLDEDIKNLPEVSE